MSSGAICVWFNFGAFYSMSDIEWSLQNGVYEEQCHSPLNSIAGGGRNVLRPP